MYIIANLVSFVNFFSLCLAGRIYDGEITKAECFPHHLTVKKMSRFRFTQFWI